MAEGNEREERLRDVLRRLRREENEEGTERRNGESEREEERATQPRQESRPSIFSLSQSLDNVFDLTPTSPPLTSSSSSTAALSSDTAPSSSSPHIISSSTHIVSLPSTLCQPSSSVGVSNVSSNIPHPLPLPSISGHISESHSPSPSSSSSSLSLIPYSTNAPSTTTRSTGFHIVPPSTTSAPPSTSRTAQGPVVDIVSLMENSRQALLESERREREEAEAAVDNAHQLRAASRLMTVPGETTATNTSQSSDQLSEEDYYTLGRMRRRRSRSCNEDQTVSTIRSLHPLSVTHSQRDAALDTPSTTESEPDQLIPGTKYESKKAQRVPKMKKRVLERQRRDLGQSSSLSETQTQTQTNRDLSGDTADGSSSSDCVMSAQTSLSGSEETSSTTVHSSEASQGGDHSSPTERTFGSLEKIKGTSRWGSKPTGISSSSVEDEEGGTDTQMIMDTDSADAVGEVPNEEDISQAELFGNAVQSHNSQDDSPNIPRWMLQQQQELQQRQELQEYRQDTEESTTNEPLGGQKRSRLDSSTSSTSSVSPMKPPTKRPVIQHDSSSSSNELVSGPRGLKTTLSTTTSTVKSPTSSIEALSSSYSSRSTALQSLQSLSSGYMASGSSLQSSSDVLSPFEPPQFSPRSSLLCVGPVDSEETTDVRVEGFTRAKGPSSLNTMTTTSNSNNSNNNGKDTTTSSSGSSTNDQSGNEKNGGNGNGKDKHGEGSDKDGGGSDEDGGGNNTHVEGGGSDAVEERGPRKLGEDSDKKGELESDLTLSSTNDSCIIIHSGTVNDSPQPSHSIETNDNLPLSPEREKEMSSSVDAGSLSILTSPINDTGLHHLEGYCTDTSTGTQTSFHLQLSPSQSGAESDDVVIVSRSTECTNVTPVLSKSPLQSSDSTVLTRRASHLPEANTDQCSAGTIELIDSSLPHSLPQVICSPPIDNSSSLHSSRSDTGTDSHPPVPVYESLQLSNTDVSHSEISPSVIQSSISITPNATPNATPLQPDSSQFTSSGTFDFRLPDIGVTSNERNVAIEDMETSDPTNDTQCPKEGEGERESDVEVLGVSEGGGGGGEPVGRSPGKCLSLRRRRSMSAGETTPNKRPKQNEEAPSTSQKKKVNTPTTNGDGKKEGNRVDERRLEDKGEGGGSLEVVGESNGGNGNHDNNMDTAVQPLPPPPRTTGFILGLVEEERDDGDKFNDSSQFVMPPITGLMNESELSPLEIPLAKANNTGSAPNTSLPFQPPSSLFAGLQHTRTKVARPDPYEFHDDEGSSSDTPSPFTMPLRRRKQEQLASNSTVDSETPIPTTVGEERDEVIQAERGEEEEEEEDVVVAATTSTPVSNEQLQPVTSITDSTLISSTPVSTLVATPITTAPNNSSLMSLSDCFVSPSSCLASHALNNLCLSHPHSPFIRLRYTTTVTTSFIRDEIVDRSTGRVVETHDHIERPSEQRRTVIEVDPLQSLPSSHIVHPFTVQQLPSSGLPLPTSNAVCNESTSTSFNMGSDSSSPAGGRGVPRQSLELSTSASPHSPLSTRRYKNTTTSMYRYAQPSSGGSASESSTPNGRARGRGAVPQRTQSFELPMESPTSITPPTSVSAEQSGFKLAVDQKVVARWKDGNWYAATIREVSPIKAYLEFYDGDHSSVSVQNILPLSILPQGIQVSRVDSDITGSLVDFSIQDSSFRLKLSNDSIIICPLEELVITSETAEMTQQLINKQSYHSKRRRKSNSKSRLLEEQLSQKESVLFNGLIFLVTDQRNSHPTGREEIESIIRGRGGYIMEEYKPNLVIDNRTYCISNSYCRTLKYLTALAVSLPCISYEWIRECVKQVKIVDHKAFSLPAGMSPYSKSLVQWQHRPNGFLRVQVHVMGGKTFKDIWEKIIVLGGGKIISKLPSRKGSSLSSGSDSQLVIVSERSNPPQSLKPSTVVSQEWLVESLLVGNVVSTEPFKRS